ncbi:MAG: hypothetical protein J5997_10705 [Oscillospiraceae bacterium]|nr:hypothetical protein [Oscillospiraceae bacterium]
MFSIDEIIAGWLNVTFAFGDDVYCIMATDLWGTDSGAQIIKMCADALRSEGCFYAVLDNEPGAWVIELCGTGRLCIYLSRDDLRGKPVLQQCEKTFETDIDVYAFSEEVYSAFSEYSEGDGLIFYERENRMAFPSEKFKRLKYALGK